MLARLSRPGFFALSPNDITTQLPPHPAGLFHDGKFLGTALAVAWFEAAGAEWIDNELRQGVAGPGGGGRAIRYQES